jgi:hypothetical protein
MIPDYLLEYDQVNGIMTQSLTYSNFLSSSRVELRAVGLLGKHPNTSTTLPAFCFRVNFGSSLHWASMLLNLSLPA